MRHMEKWYERERRVPRAWQDLANVQYTVFSTRVFFTLDCGCRQRIRPPDNLARWICRGLRGTSRIWSRTGSTTMNGRWAWLSSTSRGGARRNFWTVEMRTPYPFSGLCSSSLPPEALPEDARGRIKRTNSDVGPRRVVQCFLLRLTVPFLLPHQAFDGSQRSQRRKHRHRSSAGETAKADDCRRQFQRGPVDTFDHGPRSHSSGHGCISSMIDSFIVYFVCDTQI